MEIKRGQYRCNFKNINMGTSPYYMGIIPKNSIFYLGERMCKWVPKNGINKWMYQNSEVKKYDKSIFKQKLR